MSQRGRGGDVHNALAKRCPSPEWALTFEVPDDAGFDKRRSADAVAVNTWPSRGLEIHGFEIKVSRSDWLRELKDPSKSATVQRFCDRWWVCAGDDTIVKDGELPPMWGLLVLCGGKLVQHTAAPVLKAEPPTRGFLAAFLRATTLHTVPKAVLEGRIRDALAERRDDPESYQKAMQGMLDRVNKLQDAIAGFEQASGIPIDQWDARTKNAKIGKLVKLVLSRDHVVFDALRRALDHAEKAHREIAQADEELTALLHRDDVTAPKGLE